VYKRQPYGMFVLLFCKVTDSRFPTGSKGIGFYVVMSR